MSITSFMFITSTFEVILLSLIAFGVDLVPFPQGGRISDFVAVWERVITACIN